MNFEVCVSETFIFIRSDIIIELYVDDFLIIGMDNSVNDFCIKFGRKLK